MAGGGLGKGSGLRLQDRRRAGGQGAELAGPARHCWVLAPCDGGPRRPGLLVEWRQVSGGYQGLVVYVARSQAGGWVTVSEWQHAESLEPA